MQRRKHRTLEVSGRDVDDAIARGLARLGVSRDEVLIEVLNPSRRRLFGLSTEPARVRILYPVSGEEEEERPRDLSSSIAEEGPVSPPAEEVTRAVQPLAEDEEPVPVPAPTEEEARVAKATVEEILARMGIEAQVAVREPQENQILTLDIMGKGLGILIGPQGKTLNALQHIARLIVNRELSRWVTFFLDVEGYRQRRAKELQDLAHRMAERVALSKQPLALEPMPAHERRIIHITLHDHPLVTTESVGQGEHRHVTILPH